MLAADGSEMVSTSATTRRASISCMKRRSTAEPPERNSSTLIPVSCWNIVAIFCAVSTGVDVYQVTCPSFLAAARSTASGVNPCCARAGGTLASAPTTHTTSSSPTTTRGARAMPAALTRPGTRARAG
jgi:hypothetical protein